MLLFHHDAALFANERSAEDMQAEIQQWMQWIGGIAQQGKLVGTEQLLPIGKTINGADGVITDGPYAEVKEIIGGYLILNAESLDEAIQLAQGCPILALGGKVEVRQMRVVPA